MITKYKWLYKLVLTANKKPNKKYYLDFSSSCLNANKDFDWFYEYSKTDKVIDFIKDSIEQKFSRKEIKKICKLFCKNICFYDEHIALAKNIIKRYKSKNEAEENE